MNQHGHSPRRQRLWIEFAEVLYSPRRVFARNRNGRLLAPIVTLSATGSVLVLILLLAFPEGADSLRTAGALKGLERSGVGFREALEDRYLYLLAGTLGPIVLVPLAIGILALLGWLVGRLLGAEQTLRSAAVVAAFAHVPKVVGAAVAILGTLAVRELRLEQLGISGESLFRLVNDLGQLDLSSAVGFDLLGVWTLTLVALGLNATGGLNRSRSVVAAMVLVLLGFLPWIVKTMV